MRTVGAVIAAVLAGLAPAPSGTAQARPHGHATIDLGASTSQDAPVEPATVDHEAMDHSTMEHVPTDHAAMDHGSMDHSTMDHSTMDHSTMDPASTDRTGMVPDAPREPVPAPTDADRRAAFPLLATHPAHVDAVHHYVLFDRLETSDSRADGTPLAWEMEAWLGTDLDRLWLRSEGARVGGDTQAASVEMLYGRSVTASWDVLAGVRHEFQPRDARTWAALGVRGEAWEGLEVQATTYLGEGGHSAANVELEYDLRLTNRLILQPVVEAAAYGKDDASRGIGAGLSTAEVGLRLRHEVTRRFAPYVGIVRERAFGDTADLRRAAGDDVDATRVVAGVRVWF